VNAKIVVCLIASIFCSAIGVRAQSINKIDVFLGYSYVRAHPTNDPDDPTFFVPPAPLPNFNLHGGEAAVAYNFNRHISGVFDFAGYESSRLYAPFPWMRGTMYTFLVGPKFTFQNHSRITPYTQVLFGPAFTGSHLFLEQNQTEFSMTVGGGVDFRVNRRLSLRPVQTDYLLTHFKEDSSPFTRRVQNNLRLGVGVVFHPF
jgi:hypothetical protein